MPANLTIDDKLVETARRSGRHNTKKAAMTEVLVEYIQQQEQLKIIALFGSIEYDRDYDHKKQRKRK